MDREIDIKMLGPKAKKGDMEKILEWLNSSDQGNRYIAGRNTRWLELLSEEGREEFDLLWQDMINSIWG
jgi:hypothetical protein